MQASYKEAEGVHREETNDWQGEVFYEGPFSSNNNNNKSLIFIIIIIIIIIFKSLQQGRVIH